MTDAAAEHLAKAINGLTEEVRLHRHGRQETIIYRMERMEQRLIAAIKAVSVNPGLLTEKLKTATDSLEATVSANQPK
jgi:hypothetical protein